jgi:hypothetical protein
MNKNVKALVSLLVLAVLAFVGYSILYAPDQRSTGEKVGDAISSLDEGVDDAARELEDRTPAERIKDDIDDATDGSPE